MGWWEGGGLSLAPGITHVKIQCYFDNLFWWMTELTADKIKGHSSELNLNDRLQSWIKLMQWIEISSVYRKLSTISQPWYRYAETVFAKSRSYTLIMTLKKGMNKLFKTVHCHWVDIKGEGGGGSDGENGVWTPSGKFNFLKFTWQNYITENMPQVPWKTWISLQPPTTNFPRKKIMGRAWYPMQMSHVTNCFRQT